MSKRTVILTYSALLLLSGAGVVYLGFALDGTSISALAGAAAFTRTVKAIGGLLGAAGLAGMVWGTRLSENPTLPGYAGLNGPGVAVLLVFLFLAGPVWLLFAWALWLFPVFRVSR